jgi:hypothetical protein
MYDQFSSKREPLAYTGKQVQVENVISNLCVHPPLVQVSGCQRPFFQ